MRRGLLVLVLFTLAGFAFGVADVHIPAPDRPLVFWVGNISSLWVILPFLAGWAERTPAWAAAAGGTTCLAAILGFYRPITLFTAPGFLFPWLVIATVVGPAYGMVGSWWRRARSLVAGAAVGVPFIAEPWLWALRMGHVPRPYPI